MTSSYLIIFCIITTALSHRVIPEYEINLDLPVAERMGKVVADYLPLASVALDQVLNHKLKLLKPTLTFLAKLRGPETPEMQEEIEYFASQLGIPYTDVQIVNWLFEFSTIMVPFKLREAGLFEFLDFFGMPMCTGIVGYDQDGSVLHARNLDFSLPEYLSTLLYVGVFTKGGKEVFRGQMIVGFSGMITGFKAGIMSVEVNTRFTQQAGQNLATFSNLIRKKNPLALWKIRKTLENVQTYEEGVQTLSTELFTSPIYLIISGVKKGTILARDPASLAHQLVLGVDSSKYIVMTNFDYWNNDWREYFDPTADFYRRRIGVMKALDGLDYLTEDILFETLNREDVVAHDTIYQGIMNVEKGIFKATCPYVPKE